MTPRISGRLTRFCVVGATGVAVNMGILILFTERLRLPYAISSLFAIEMSILSNFALNNAWTWSDRRDTSLLRRLLKYHAVAGLTAMMANWCLLVVLTKFLGWDYRVSNLIGIAVGVLVNFVLNHVWTFGQDVQEKTSGAMGIAPKAESAAPAAQRNRSAPRRLLWSVVAVLAVVTGLKIYFATHAELLSEEAYYWSYLQHPALGYFDHPPMVAWVIGVGTSFFGDTEMGVRLGFILLSLGSTWLVFQLARSWFGPTQACWAALLFNLLPIFIAVGLLAFPDGPLVFFWLLTLNAVTKAIGIGSFNSSGARPPAVGAGSTLSWLLAGVAFGGALLSKYTAVLLGGSLGLFLLISPRHRHWLRRPQPWIAGFVALLVFSPVIIWNAQHEWASFLFQSTRTIGQKPDLVKNVTLFWLLQFSVLGPLLFVFALAVWRSVQRGWFRHDDRWNFAVSFGIPLFLVFFLASFKTDVHINWTAPCFLSLTLAVAALFQEGIEDGSRAQAMRWRWAGSSAAVFAVGAVALGLSVMVFGFPSALTSSRFGGWRELAKRVVAEEAEVARTSGQQPFVVGADKYHLSAQLGFYSRAPQSQINSLAFGKHGLGFHYWTDMHAFEGRPAVVVVARKNPATLSDLATYFTRVGAAKRVEIPTAGHRTRILWLIDCYGYRATPSASFKAVAHNNRSGNSE